MEHGDPGELYSVSKIIGLIPRKYNGNTFIRTRIHVKLIDNRVYIKYHNEFR